MKRKIKAVIFDLDGVLIDSEVFWQISESTIFNQFGLPITEEMTKQTMGLRVDEVIEYWSKKFDIKNEDKLKMEESIQKEVISLINKKGKPLPGTLKVINELVNQNFPLAIASSSSLKIIKASIKKFGIEKYFSVICSAENEQFGKPHPAVYLSCAKKLNVNPNNCLVFEDSVNGVRSAKAANMMCYAIASNHVNKNKLSQADRILTSLNEFSIKDII
ncbi:MAG: hexitol phosphatase HxpB [Nanoarchaeota archaeon]